MKRKKGRLILENGMTIDGYSFGADTPAAGEVVFNTAMTGYTESLTDPSYTGQILLLTYPLIGNYGIPGEVEASSMQRFYESDSIQAAGLIVCDYSYEYSHWNAKKSLSDWLIENNVPALSGIDTRKLTKVIREQGTMLGKIIISNKDIPFYDPDTENLVARVSTDKKVILGNGNHRILLIDCGAKNNIIRCLLERDTTIIRVPWDYDFRNEDYDGILISNGPGNPRMCDTTIEHLRYAIGEEKPVFGICLGHQLLALASGAETYKLKYGHRSHNQPVIRCGSERAYISSQNHGFAVDDDSLGDDWIPLFRNLNDGTNEGLRHKEKPFFSVQFHPEASSGPTDTEFLFDDFIEMIKTGKGIV